MKKILVPTDFSKYSEYALQAAAIIAKQHNAEILALNMMGLSHTGLNKSSAQRATEALFHLKIAEKEFKFFLNKEYLKGIRVKEMVKDYTIFSELNELTLNQDIDLVVMGSHGASGVEEMFVGSNTEKVVRTSDIPVLVIKSKPDNLSFSKVVFASDFKTESVNVYRSAMKLFKSFNSNVHLLHINVPHKFNTTKQMKERANAFIELADVGDIKNLEKVAYYNDRTVEEGIHNYCEKINADIVAIPTHGRQGLAHFFNGSISEDLANHEGRPVLTFKIK